MNVLYILKILLSNYKKLIINITVSVLLGTVILSSLNFFETRNSPLEPFIIGIVIEDENQYLDILLDMVLKRDDFKSTVSFFISDLESVQQEYDNETIPAYIIIPNGFTDSVMTGENKNIFFVGNKNYSIQYSVADTIVKAMVSFLSSSQSGIYATLNMAREQNIDEDIIKNEIVNNINLEFGKALLNYKAYFKNESLYISGKLPIKEHYLNSFIIFFIMLNCIFLFEPLNELLNKNIMERIASLNYKTTHYILNIYLSLFILIFILCSIFIFKFGFNIIFLALFLSSLTLFCSVFFRNLSGNSIFILSASIFMLFISGGIVPVGLLPAFISKISFLSINHYLLLDDSFSRTLIYTLVFTLISLLFILFKYTREDFN